MMPTRIAHPPLDRDEFKRRCDVLRAAGKPLTMENIHPEMFEHHLRRIRSIQMQMRILVISAALFFGAIVLAAVLASFRH